jgi:hypothetical protein
VTDLRRGFTGLSGMVQTVLKENPFSGQGFVFRGRRGDYFVVPPGRDLRAQRSGTIPCDVGGLGVGNQPAAGVSVEVLRDHVKAEKLHADDVRIGLGADTFRAMERRQRARSRLIDI